MSDVPRPDLDYNQNVPEDWWLTDWRPSKWCFGTGPNGSGYYGVLDDTPCVHNNAYCILKYFKKIGWSFQSICAMLGNLWNESQMQPGFWQGGNYGQVSDDHVGYGLTQWTPPNKFILWADTEWGADDPYSPYFYSGWYQCYRIACEMIENDPAQWMNVYAHSSTANPNRPERNYLTTRDEFMKGICPQDVPDTLEDRLNYLTSCFYWQYEQVALTDDDPSENTRKSRARQFYDHFSPIFGDFDAKDNIIMPSKPNANYGFITLKGAWLLKAFSNSSKRTREGKLYGR